MNDKDIFFDRKHIWHPYDSITNPFYNQYVISANKCKIKLKNGKEIIDGMSSWWTAIHGYNNPEINKALINQIKNINHIMFGGITHLPAINLCKKLIEITPKNLDCVFLADSGSVAIEVSIKMSIQYWKSLGYKKNKFLSFKRSYHGDTFGAISVCDPINSMHSIYGDYLSKNYFFDILKKNINDHWDKNDEKNLVKVFEKHHKKLSAVIIEPIVQSVGGMNFYHPKYLSIIRKLCDYYNVLLIADEIATGFGRTGKLFAFLHSKIVPDILCLGKALTGGTITLSAALTTRNIADVISFGNIGKFMHGPTFMGNPLACTAAYKSIRILEKKDWKKNINKINFIFKNKLKPLIYHPIVRDVRILGAIGVVETIYKINLNNIQKFFIKNGIWLRPLNKIIYIIPPYIISEEELVHIIKIVEFSLKISSNFFF
ncbi:MAG: adenosylmethionine--8-amino-7-oxononanoate transaminase [Enterobacteriaceae bacterium]